MEKWGQSGWRVVGESVRGAAHERAGMPNQDAIRWEPLQGGNPPLVLCLSDGHGGARYCRSDVGSRLAVDTGVEVIREFLAGHEGVDNLSVVKRSAEEKLTQALARRWREAVAAHIAEQPLTAGEELLLVGRPAAAAAPADAAGGEATTAAGVRAAIPGHVAYGATLLAAVVAPRFILYLQLGDGDILAVSTRGEVVRPLAGDERLFANETTSLCSKDAWRDFRVSFQVSSGEPPALIVLSTDGYANCFRGEADFLKVGSDFLEMMRANGVESVAESLESWLAEASRVGSGDDITLGIMCRLDALSRTQPAEPDTGGGAGPHD
ncbi:MAG TPA: PP2C family serine/threonine-protein phosphatase [Pyrinomonadaceae bacterium]|jgi:serine/threonine protein phosphatase PrpC|nr:PP2C family serine/threonine-protein phosphatase [Pyrinomonadaceae bacterium]